MAWCDLKRLLLHSESSRPPAVPDAVRRRAGSLSAGPGDRPGARRESGRGHRAHRGDGVEGGGGGVGRREAEGVPPRHRRGVPRDAQGMGAAGRLRSAGLLPDALQERPLAPGRAGGGRRGSAAGD